MENQNENQETPKAASELKGMVRPAEDWIVVDVPTPPLKDGCWVKIIEVIRNNVTGEIREHESKAPLYDGEGETEPDTFIWEEGNYACDCNRSLFFGYAAGEDRDDNESPCGDGAYSVQLRNPKTGRVFYDEFAEQG